MKKAKNKKGDHINFVLRKSDILLEIIDARFPKITRIYNIENYLKKKGKTLIIVLNKSDLVPEDFLEVVRTEFSKEYPTVYVSAKTRKGSRTLRRYIKEYSPEKEKIYIGVFGYPNTGKSSIINMLVGRHRARTSSYAGFTRGIQLVKLSSKHYLIDSPGIVPYKDKYTAAMFGAINAEELDYPELAVKKALEILPKSPIKEYYNISFKDYADLLEKIAEFYNIKGSDYIRRAAIRFLKDLAFGKIRIYIY